MVRLEPGCLDPNIYIKKGDPVWIPFFWSALPRAKMSFISDINVFSMVSMIPDKPGFNGLGEREGVDNVNPTFGNTYGNQL